MIQHLVGTDEVGYGSLAGSLLVCGVRAPTDWTFEGLKDSKKLTPKRRQELRDQLLILAAQGDISFQIEERTNEYIDMHGVYRALKKSHIEVIRSLYQDGDRIIVDGNLKFDEFDIGQMKIESVIKADNSVPHVMAAAIIAKTTRDARMVALAKEFPQYQWEKNKGYGSKEHIQAIVDYGITPLHRMSYDPMRSMNKTAYQSEEKTNEDDNQ